jgi:sphinganine-1-phosphate aldolase
MRLEDLALRALGRVDRRVLAAVERRLMGLPPVRRRLEQEYDSLIGELESSLRPYRERFPAYRQIPERGCDPETLLQQLEEMRAAEEGRWQDGFVSGAVYHGDPAHVDFLNRVYAIQSQSNPLHPDIWPSAAKFEAEIVAMTAALLGGGDPPGTSAEGQGPSTAAGSPSGEIVGCVTSGGTESILLAMKTYRDWARARRGIRRPEMVVPVSAHAAFDKAAEYFDMRMVKVPVRADGRADPVAVRRAITRRTAVVVGSAPSFPHGVVDPILELSELARERGAGFHTDACLGGFVLPWARRLGYAVPPFDFSLPGVTSMSADTHKFGYAAKGTSVVLYRGQELRRFQYFATADWPGGLYCTPTFSGSRPGALSAAAWASLLAMGEEGFLEATRRILEAADSIRHTAGTIPGLRILGESPTQGAHWVIAFVAAEDGLGAVNIYEVMDGMGRRGWSLNGLFSPPAMHLCVTLRHAQPGVAERFVADLRAAVDEARRQPGAGGEMAPIYGLAGRIPVRGWVEELPRRYLDMLYRVGP